MRVGWAPRRQLPPLFSGYQFIFALFALLLSCSTALADPGSSRLVLVVYPNESEGSPGMILVNRVIRNTFANESSERIEIRNEYVDTSRLHDTDFCRAQVSFLKRKYEGRKVDLIMAGLSSGLDFVLAHRHELFPIAPVVFIAVDERETRDRQLPADVFGVPIRMAIGETLDVALSIHPETRKVYVVAGDAPIDMRWESEARQRFRHLEQKLEFVYLIGLPMSDLVERVSALPDNSVIYYLHIHRDGAGVPYFPATALEGFASKANAPIYSHVETYIGRGTVGGKVFSFEGAAVIAARLGIRILAGEQPGQAALANANNNSYQFDARELDRWGINPRCLPPGSIVLNQGSTTWDLYKWHILSATGVCLVQAILIAGMLFQRARRRRADERFRQVIETAPIGMLMVSQTGVITMANTQVEKLFGYRKDVMIGKPVEMLIPERARPQHIVDRMRYFAAPEVRPMGLGRDLFGRRSDGREFPIEIGLSPLRTPQGRFILASIVDLTERRRAEDELRKSQMELRHLAGRLLKAQEAERRRIARELHDDLNQSLALLAVGVDALGHRPPSSPVEFTIRMAEVSKRVRELSSTVHQLSHQLHPSKLEHLGLEASIIGLCLDMSHGHGLDVQFEHPNSPLTIPLDTATCLYRIVQEALRNVVKHSGSGRATVELRQNSTEINLGVADEGVGFDPISSGGHCGLGLISMRERLHLIGGTLEVDSSPGCGTRIYVRVQLSGTRPESAQDAHLPTEVMRCPDHAFC